jgi:hypothetical protein
LPRPGKVLPRSRNVFPRGGIVFPRAGNALPRRGIVLRGDRRQKARVGGIASRGNFTPERPSPLGGTVFLAGDSPEINLRAMGCAG